MLVLLGGLTQFSSVSVNILIICTQISRLFVIRNCNTNGMCKMDSLMIVWRLAWLVWRGKTTLSCYGIMVKWNESTRNASLIYHWRWPAVSVNHPTAPVIGRQLGCVITAVRLVRGGGSASRCSHRRRAAVVFIYGYVDVTRPGRNRGGRFKRFCLLF